MTPLDPKMPQTPQNTPNSSDSFHDSLECPIWRIKYRPRTLDEIKSLYPKLYPELKGYVSTSNFPHIMLVGPTGSGKTLLAEILAREILKHEMDFNFKILYADDPIGKEERKEAKRQGHLSAKMVGSGAGTQRNYRPFIQVRVRPFVSMQKFGEAPFKILAIKNFHSLDIEQQAFRRIMEQYSNNCRMILITDKISGIIDPIISRCQLIMVPQLATFRFNKLLKDICIKEKLEINLNAINYIRHVSKNNVGQALDLLQATYLKNNSVKLAEVSNLFTQMSNRGVLDLIAYTIDGKMNSIRSKLRDIFKTQKLSKNEILLEMSQVITQLPLERRVQAFYLDLIAETDFTSIDSRNDEIHLSALLSKMAVIGKIQKE